MKPPPPRGASLPDSARGSVLRDVGLCLAVAVVAALVAGFFFTPRWEFWRGLDLPQQFGSPETHRAYDTRIQLQDPWAPVGNDSNKVIQWRLLFPIIWHYLHLPWGLYLALPFVGCLLTLWLVAWLAYERLGDWAQTALVATLFATLPWFFVSTGWLTYFDSWLVLGLLLSAFIPSRVVLAITCLTIPWIDERFVLALPMTFFVRAIALRRIEQRQWSALLVDAAVVLVASLPYPAVRAVAWLRGDPDSTAYVQKHWEDALGVSVTRYLEGLWSGYRAAWVMVVAAVWFCSRRVNRAWGALFALLVIGSSLGGLFVAADMSRTLMMECTVLLLGICLWQQASPTTFRIALPLVLAANLLLPAQHVIWPFTVPIRYLYAQLDSYRMPSQRFQPNRYLDLGMAARQKGFPDQALKFFDVALKLDPNCAMAYVNRATIALDAQNPNGALTELANALRIDPNLPDALVLRALALLQKGESAAGLRDLRRALEIAPPDWPMRGEAEDFLKRATAPAQPATPTQPAPPTPQP